MSATLSPRPFNADAASGLLEVVTLWQHWIGPVLHWLLGPVLDWWGIAAPRVTHIARVASAEKLRYCMAEAEANILDLRRMGGCSNEDN